MKLLFFAGIFLCFLITLNAQVNDSSEIRKSAPGEDLKVPSSRLSIGGYGEVHFNQSVSKNIRRNGELDVHRMVLLLEYNYDSRIQFISEIEFEHVRELFVEQAYLQYRINKFMQFRAGLLLIPMGIINEFHEPTSFNGVERPLIDGKISPSTWREIGFGISGTILPVSMKYQAYLVNGFKSYDETGLLSGKDGLRGGRQKGAESIISSPDISSRIEYFGLRGLTIGLSGYFGKTESTLYNGVNKFDAVSLLSADSSVIGVSMVGADVRYTKSGFQGRSQFYYARLSNAKQYNAFTSKDGINNNLGSALAGYYLEVGYNVFRHIAHIKPELIPFIRFEEYDMHYKVDGEMAKDPSLRSKALATGLTLKLASGAVLKTDLQFNKSSSSAVFSKVFNAGVAVLF